MSADPINQLGWLRADCGTLRDLLARIPDGLSAQSLRRRLEENEQEIAALVASMLAGDDYNAWVAAMRYTHPDAESLDVPARFVRAPESSEGTELALYLEGGVT